MFIFRFTVIMCIFLSLLIIEFSFIIVEIKVKGVFFIKRGFCKKGKKFYCYRIKFLKK